MNWKTWLFARRWWIGGVFALLAAYFVARAILAAVSARQGFGSPDGPGAEFLAAGAISSLLRGLLLVVVPAVVACRVVAGVCSWVLSSIGSAADTDRPSASR